MQFFPAFFKKIRKSFQTRATFFDFSAAKKIEKSCTFFNLNDPDGIGGFGISFGMWGPPLLVKLGNKIARDCACLLVFGGKQFSIFSRS